MIVSTDQQAYSVTIMVKVRDPAVCLCSLSLYWMVSLGNLSPQLATQCIILLYWAIGGCELQLHNSTLQGIAITYID